jgi:hypothetical protein
MAGFVEAESDGSRRPRARAFLSGTGETVAGDSWPLRPSGELGLNARVTTLERRMGMLAR